MKVLSLTEPYATLIKEKKKKIETRSWKTDYRGEIYIHASATKIPKVWKNDDKLMSLVTNIPLNFGYIICKCNLVDCIYMTKEYIKKIKKTNCQEFVCGVYEEGRYAWILEDIVPLKTPIKAKGQLGIWNYYDAIEVMNLMKDIEYGWIDKNNNKYTILEKFSNAYLLQSPNQVIKNKIGTCLEQVELERYYLKANDWSIRTYFIIYYDNKEYPFHTFLTFKKNNKYYWFEHSWEKFRGIHEYGSLEKLLVDIKNKFIKDALNDDYKHSNLILYEYTKPMTHITVQAFINHCEHGKRVDLNKLKAKNS